MKLSISTLRKLVKLKQKTIVYLQKTNIALEETNERLEHWSLSLLDSMQKPKHQIEDSFGDISSVLRRTHKGFTIDGRLQISQDQSRKGLLISGKTGAGKTVKVLLPCLYNIDNEASIMIHDPSQEIFILVAGYLQSQGYKIVIIDFTNPKTSARYNPLLRLMTKAQYNAFAYTLVSNQAKGKMDFWNSKAVTILVFLIELQKQLPEKYNTLYNLYHLTEQLQSEAERESFDKLVVEVSKQNPGLFTTYSSIVSMSENTLSGVLSTLSNALSIYGLDEDLACITSEDTLGDLSKIRQEKTAVFIHSSTTKLDYYSPISTLFFNQYFDVFFQKLPDGRTDRDVYFMLDESPVLQIFNLDIIASNIRKYRGNLCLVGQNPTAQFTSTFGKEKAQTIISNLNTHVYLSIDLEEATTLEKELGTYTYKDEDSERTITRPLKTKTELMGLSSQDKGIVTITGKRPLLVKFTPYYKTPFMLRKSKMKYKRQTSEMDIEPSAPACFVIEDYLKICSTSNFSSDGQD